MINIACCDDNPIQNVITEEILLDYENISGNKINVSYFSNGKDLLTNVKQIGGYDIYILDMIMPEINGIDIAKKLRRISGESIIIFLTSSKDYLLESYDVKTFFYLLKPINIKKLYSVLDDAIKVLKAKNNKSIHIKAKEGEKRLFISSISHIDKANRCLAYHLIDGKVIESLSLRTSFADSIDKDILGNEEFVTCGMSLIINMNQIDSIDKDSVKMKNGNHIFPPVSSMNSLRKSVLNFWDS